MSRKFRKNRRGLNLTRNGLILLLVVGLNLFGYLSIGSTTAFYNDSESSNGNFLGATSLDFSVESEKEDNRFQTFTQGGWGSKARGHNPGRYRDDNFDSAFPDGAIIGLSGSYYSATFTDAEAIEDFLPAGSTPSPFNQDHVNPTTTEAGVLAGQALALTLNIGFDLYDPDFAPSVNNLKDYVIHDATIPCDGFTVQTVLNEVNLILGGAGGSLTPAEANECATWINEKFNEGGEDGLVPGGSITQFATIFNEGLLDFQYTVHVEKTSGDDEFCNVLDLEAFLEGASIYSGDLMTFVSPNTLYSDLTDEWEFVISLPAETDAEGSCGFDFVYSGWQTNLETFGGFSNIERVDDPVHSAASVSVESSGIKELPPDEDEPTIQSLSLEEIPKVEESITGEEIVVEDESDGEIPEEIIEEEQVMGEEAVVEGVSEVQEETVSDSEEEEITPPVQEDALEPVQEEVTTPGEAPSEPVEEEIETEEGPVEPPVDAVIPEATITEETAS